MREEKSARASIVLAIRYVAQPLPMGLIPPATWNIAGSGLISKANILLLGRRPRKATTQDILSALRAAQRPGCGSLSPVNQPHDAALNVTSKAGQAQEAQIETQQAASAGKYHR